MKSEIDLDLKKDREMEQKKDWLLATLAICVVAEVLVLLHW